MARLEAWIGYPKQSLITRPIASGLVRARQNVILTYGTKRLEHIFKMPDQLNRYSRIIEEIFFQFYQAGDTEVTFQRQDLREIADELGMELPKNLGDIIYSFKFRAELPEKIRGVAPEGYGWMIRNVGRSRYQFKLTKLTNVTPSEMLVNTKVPDATPGVIRKYSIDDEQGLLAVLRYNRLIDIFTGLTCYSLQSHFRTTVPGIGQIETDEVYIGLDKRGVHYVIPIQAKGGSDRIGVAQIEQDFALCKAKFPELIAKPIAAQFMAENVIALFEFEEAESEVGIALEKHYQLVNPEELSVEDLRQYQTRTAG